MDNLPSHKPNLYMMGKGEMNLRDSAEYGATVCSRTHGCLVLTQLAIKFVNIPIIVGYYHLSVTIKQLLLTIAYQPLVLGHELTISIRSATGRLPKPDLPSELEPGPK